MENFGYQEEDNNSSESTQPQAELVELRSGLIPVDETNAEQLIKAGELSPIFSLQARRDDDNSFEVPMAA